jgi:ribosomal protein L7/L12
MKIRTTVGANVSYPDATEITLAEGTDATITLADKETIVIEASSGQRYRLASDESGLLYATEVTLDLTPDEFKLVEQNKMIQAIKSYRDRVGCPLATAKEFCGSVRAAIMGQEVRPCR